MPRPITEAFELPLNMLAGEQTNVVVPFDKIVMTDDEDVLSQSNKDKRKNKFIYAYTDSGVSKNKRDWKPSVIESIGEQVLTKLPVGYLGHIKPQDYGFDFPEPQIIWLGSYAEKLSETSDDVRLWLKGYLLPTADKLEKWIQIKAVNSISVYGMISYADKDGVKEIESVDLKSIDISRKLGEGLNSQIVGLFGEMDATYEEVRESLSEQIRSRVREKLSGITMDNYRPYYCNAWVEKMFVGENRAIVNVNHDSNDGEVYRHYEAKYSISDDNKVSVTSLKRVVKKENYEPIVDANDDIELSEAGEMSVNNKEEVSNMDRLQVIAGLKVEDLLQHNPTLITALKTAVVEEMNSAEAQKSVLVKAGEMDKIVGLVGEGHNVVETISSILNTNKSFVGEMACVLGIAGESDEAGVTPEQIVEKAKEVVEAKTQAEATINSVAEVVGKAEDQTVVDAVKNVVDINRVSRNKTWVEDVNAKFTELSADVKHEQVLEFVKDDFQAILDIKPEEISEEDWKDKAIKHLEEDFQGKVDKYSERLKKVIEKAKAVGEMNAFEDLGNNLGGEQEKEDVDVDPDVALAKKLGYGNKI